MQKTKLAAEELAEMIRDGLAEEGHDVQVHPDPEIGWDVAVTSANELGTRQVPPARRAIPKVCSPVRFPNVASGPTDQFGLRFSGW